jgi:hypothetical protein
MLAYKLRATNCCNTTGNVKLYGAVLQFTRYAVELSDFICSSAADTNPD